MNVQPRDSLIKTIYTDEQFWGKNDTKKLLSDLTKVNVLRDKLLKNKPGETLAHIAAVGKLLTKNDPKLEKEAIQFLRSLKTQLEFTQEQMQNLSHQPNHPDALYPAMSGIGESLEEIDRLLVKFGKILHTRENLPKQTTAQKTHTAAAASTALSSVGQTIPASSTRPFESEVASSTATAVPFMRELLLGIENNTSEYLLEGGTKAVTVPTIFGVDVMRGTYMIKGKVVHADDQPSSNAIEAYRKYCQLAGGTNEGYALASLLGQSHFFPLTQTAQELFSEKGLFAKAQFFTFDVDKEKQIVTITLKAVMEASNPMEKKDAILAKREIQFPLQELKDAAAFLDNLNEVKGLLERFGGIESAAKIDVLKNLVKSSVTLLPSATAVDTISSPIATAEYAHTFLSDF